MLFTFEFVGYLQLLSHWSKICLMFGWWHCSHLGLCSVLWRKNSSR